ncbi:hypothetical protein [Sphingomonas glaciei]|uniref:Uncharacterized protein n=1 Tax=Sphingomonas glaciei TaxID=2938948 RepID=A0ABY5MXD9_9SPHN|nr:hypothetical protein [Sphingomonas glaciei]UUR09115.1 hypothetical protein M1K48_05725 [Sphingomonas glaciei]
MSGPAPDFPDEAIRIELKRMVDQQHTMTLERLEEVASEILNSDEGTQEKREQVAEKVKRAEELASLRFSQIIAFIDRNA